MRIAILRDEVPLEGAVDEQDNLIEADFVESILSKSHIVRQIPFSSDLKKVISDLGGFQPDLVFNIVESVCNSGLLSTVAVQLLDAMHIPYTGNRLYAQIISADKELSRRILQEKNIPSPGALFEKNAEFILKAKTEHASIALDDGCIMTFPSEKEMQKELEHRKKQTGFEWIAERYIDGREFNCAFLGDVVLPPAEMCFAPEFEGHKILTYEAKWDEESLPYQQSRRSFIIDESVKNELIRITDECRNKLLLEGYARVDYRMDRNGKLFVIDINTNPCISPDSGFVAMVRESGIGIAGMFDKIIDAAF